MATSSLKRKKPEPSPPPTSALYHSTKIHDRASIFTAVFSPTTPHKLLQSLPEYLTASHRIAAWRTPSKQRALFGSAPATFDTGFDDDGEKYGGKRALQILEKMGAVGAIVVARWYGGVMLGPVRFDHIEQVAREAVEAYQKAIESQNEEADREKRRKTEDSARARLVRDLPQRDQSIVALRGLLAEKRGDVPKSSGESGTPRKEMDYTKMSLEVLRKLEKARDTTLGWLLKSIDEVEAQAKERTVTKEATVEKRDGLQGEEEAQKDGSKVANSDPD